MDVIISREVLERCRTIAGGILVGQRATIRVNGSLTQRCTVMCVAPCEDVTVIMEQVECIEQVLPANLQVVGVAQPSKTTPSLLSSLKDHKAYHSMFEIQCADGTVRAPTAAAPGGSSHNQLPHPIRLREQDVQFSLVNCVVHSPLTLMPLLITATSGASFAVDLETHHPISPPASLGRTEQLSAKQLGCSELVAPSFPVVVSFHETSGSSLRTALEQFVSRYGMCGKITHRVSSVHHAPLVYCHACDATCSLASLLETIEDGMSERLSECRDSPTQAVSSEVPQLSSQPTRLFLAVTVCVLIAAALYALAF